MTMTRTTRAKRPSRTTSSADAAYRHRHVCGALRRPPRGPAVGPGMRWPYTLQSRRRVAMAEPGCDDGHSFASVEGHRGLKVTKVMRSRLHAELLAQSMPRLSDSVGRQRFV